MISACVFGVLLFHPGSSLSEYTIFSRNLLMGVAMGVTAIGIFTSPWGKRSGAHINPAVTLTFLRLKKVSGADALFYVLFQFAGGTFGVLLAWLALGDELAAKEVNFLPTVPGQYGVGAAFIGEAAIAFVMMWVVLFTNDHHRLRRYTPYFASILVAIYIAVESPISGMSMNPARTFASAIVGNTWTAWWIYFIAPATAMLAAAEVHLRIRRRRSSVVGSRLDHPDAAACT